MGWLGRMVGATSGAILLLGVDFAHAQISDGVVRIGILNDQAGVYSDHCGTGSLVAARMAIEDAGGRVRGTPVDIVLADHQNKVDIGSAIARQWFDEGKVDMAIDLCNSAVALAVQHLAREKNRIAIATAVATADFTGRACSPTAIAWTHDSYSLTTTLARSLVRRGLDSWFFITVDYTFGHSLEADATASIKANGGKILGSARYPLNAPDFSSYLLQAKASGAKVVALANGGSDMRNASKQASEFGIAKGGQSLVALLAFITDIHGLGLEATQGLSFVTAFYWDRNDETRAWSRRFFERHGKMPSQSQASVYSAIRHYLRAIEAAGTDETTAVMAKMRAVPVDDMFSHGGIIREDGRMVHDLYLVQVKAPAEQRYPWDYYRVLETIPADQAFRPLQDGGCPLVRQRPSTNAPRP
jgi:branched-chain amino acid transport system substrate-binding protein